MNHTVYLGVILSHWWVLEWIKMWYLLKTNFPLSDQHLCSEAGTFHSLERHCVKHSMKVITVIFHFRTLLVSHDEITVRLVFPECMLVLSWEPLHFSVYLTSQSQSRVSGTIIIPNFQQIKGNLGRIRYQRHTLFLPSAGSCRSDFRIHILFHRTPHFSVGFRHACQWWRSHDQR